MIARALNGYKIVVNKSTVPVGTGEFVCDIIRAERAGSEVDFDVVSNPEFLREGSAIADSLHPDRIVIGAPNSKVALRIIELYAPLERPMVTTDVASAEMIKYASNAFLATKISFINAVANICTEAGADVTQVMKGMGYDQRIGSAFLQAGLGYGGSCFPKDTLALIQTGEKIGYDFQLLKSVVARKRATSRTYSWMLWKKELKRIFRRGPLPFSGLAFKPNTDDLRDAKSIEIISRLLASGATVRVYDPIAMSKARDIFPNIYYGESAYDAADGGGRDGHRYRMERVQTIESRSIEKLDAHPDRL